MKLVVVGGPMKGKTFGVAKFPLIVGRGRSADACLPRDPQISRFHCQIVQKDGSLLLEDLGSGNGTHLDGVQVDDAVTLPLRHLVRIGHTHFCLAGDDDRVTSLPSPPSDGESGRSAGAARGSARQWWDLTPGEEGVSLVAEDRPDRDFEITGRLEGGDDKDASAPADAAASNRLRKRLRAFQDVAAALSGKMDAKAILDAAVDGILKVLPADRAVVLHADASAKKLKAVVFRQRGRSRDTEIAVSRTLVRRVLKEKTALLVRDALSDKQLSEARSVMSLQVRSVIAVPLTEGERVMGVLLLDTKSAHAFGPDDLELVAGIARQASLALANARLYEAVNDAYEELETAHDQMVRSEKLSLIGTLAASIAHDVGNIMTPIDGIARLALRDHSLDPELKAAFGRNMERLKALMQQLLSFSKPKAPELAPVDVNAMLKDSLSLVTTNARHAGVEIKMVLADGLPRVQADRNRLDQVVVNLVVNAVHAMKGMKPQGGTLTVTSRAKDGDVEIEFRDSGPGISPEHLEVIFEPFFTTKGKEGTGMGLFSCKRIVEEEHHGDLSVTSKPGAGATFVVRLPATGG